MALRKERQVKEGINRRRSLAGVPVLHSNVTVMEEDKGIIALKAQLKRGAGFFERFRPLVSEKTYQLDEFGAFVVREIQQRKAVLDIVRAFEARFHMSHRESELGVVAFLKMLMKRNVLSIMVGEQG